jgi:hypothetical protein
MRRERIEPSSIAFQAIVLPLNYPLHSDPDRIWTYILPVMSGRLCRLRYRTWVGQESNLRDRSMSTISSKLPTHWTVWDLNPCLCRERATSWPTRRTVTAKTVFRDLPINCIGIEPMSLLCESKILPLDEQLMNKSLHLTNLIWNSIALDRSRTYTKLFRRQILYQLSY